MIVVIKDLLFKALKDELLKLHVIEKDDDYGEKYYRGKGRHRREKYGGDCEIDLSALTRKECQKLAAMLEACGVHGSKIAASDVRKYLKIAEEGIDKARARTCRQAAWMLESFFAALPHHTIFSKDEYGGDSHSGYYVADVDYEPEKPGDRHNQRQEEYTTFDLWHVEDDRRQCSKTTLHRGDCLEMTCLEILAKQGLVPETPTLMAKLRSETERFYVEREQVGKQHVAVGVGLCDLDNALKNVDREERNWRRGSRKLKLDQFGESRVVVDVLKEKEDADRDHINSGRDGFDPYRWHKWNMRFHAPSEDEVIKHLEADDDTADPVDVDVPVHPLVPCFDLRRQTRLRIHVNNLTPYTYDRNVSERLVLPDRDWKMVELLVDHSANTFEDIVSNKGRSMNVLAVGPPGTGKTATAEVFAEFKGRPLYTVQCSQLGMDAGDVEHNLGIIMQRANRWNAVLLLDEADVYIRKRGTDLNQNAIVGAFLRVLEYASCILFMTSNLGDQVDDAITSRCIAKLNYEAPEPEGQSRIWKILADLNEIDLKGGEIDKIVKRHPRLTGRDVKNLLKLASFVAQGNGQVVDAKTVEYALQFKPTE